MISALKILVVAALRYINYSLRILTFAANPTKDFVFGFKFLDSFQFR